MPRGAAAKPGKTPALASPPADDTARHAQGLAISTEITSWWHEARGTSAMQIKPKDVIDVLNKAGVRFVLMGAHAMAGWLKGEARATLDVDVLIRKQHHKKAVAAISAAFPSLIAEENPVVTRFRDPALDVVVIDLMKPSHDIHAAVFENTVSGGKSHDIPSLEMALASKFAAMMSPNRQQPRKLTDAGDFGNMTLANRDKIDREKLHSLGELVYPGGGVDIIAMMDDFLQGRPIKL
ncbi:MAG: hypothetical protein WD768_08335 [Phycisphaeraceae bacterium]